VRLSGLTVRLELSSFQLTQARYELREGKKSSYDFFCNQPFSLTKCEADQNNRKDVSVLKLNLPRISEWEFIPPKR
jgi:hypothetical protein